VLVNLCNREVLKKDAEQEREICMESMLELGETRLLDRSQRYLTNSQGTGEIYITRNLKICIPHPKLCG
jgi:hypothetical protein